MAGLEEALGGQFEKLKLNSSNADTDINILLLGETGVGKSTFINALVNYLTYSSDIERAENNKLEVLIPSVINITDRHGNNRKISVGSRDQNEILNTGESATQDVKTYVFPIWNNQAKVRIIDTPGMGDTRGITQDDINSENILTYISQLNELHAICFLFRPNNSRSTIFFKYCIAQIFSRLDKSASDNIIFVFTGTRGVNYSPGDTMDILHKTVDDIRNRPPHVKIPIARNIFCFENESFKYLAGLRQNVEFSKSDKEKYKESWKKSALECWRLIKYIVGDAKNPPLKPHFVRNTKAVNEARRVIIHMAQPLADISELINDNMHMLQRHEDNLQLENVSLDELRKKLYMPVINLEVVKQTQPVTVCTSRSCSEIYKVGELNKWHYKQRCHDPCYLTNVPKEIIGSPELVNCAAINHSTKKCNQCTCDFSIHMHIYYMTKTKQDKIKDSNVAKNLNTKEKLLEKKRTMIADIEIRKAEYENEQKVIIKTCAKFAHFLENNAITPFSDCYKEYIEYLIKRENSLGQMCNMETLNDLRRLLVEYEEAKRFFDESKTKSGTSSTVSPEEIAKGIQTLYGLKHTGQKIKELYECQTSSRKKEYKNTEYIHKNISKRSDKNEDKKDKNKTKDNKKTKDGDNKKTKDSDRENSRYQRRDNNYQRQNSGRNNSINFQHSSTGNSSYPRDSSSHNSQNPHNIPPLMGMNNSAPPLRPYENTEQPYRSYSGYDINIQVNRPDQPHFDTANTPYSNLPSQGSSYDPSYQYGHPSYTQPQGRYPYNYHDPGAYGAGYYPPPNAYGGYQQPYGPPGQYSGYPPQGYQHPSHAGNFHNQHQRDNRPSGNRRSRNNYRNNDFRGGRGRRGVNKNYKSDNQKKKSGKKETDSDSDSSYSCDSSES